MPRGRRTRGDFDFHPFGPGNSHSRASAPCDSPRCASLNRPQGALGYGASSTSRPPLNRPGLRPWTRSGVSCLSYQRNADKMSNVYEPWVQAARRPLVVRRGCRGYRGCRGGNLRNGPPSHRPVRGLGTEFRRSLVACKKPCGWILTTSAAFLISLKKTTPTCRIWQAGVLHIIAQGIVFRE